MLQRTLGGETYGSTFHPTSYGSAGSPGFSFISGTSPVPGGDGGRGGGSVRVIASHVETAKHGTITANGGPGQHRHGTYGGGGSGGSLWVTARRLRGRGTLSANGGIGGANSNSGGSGGGGRLALYLQEEGGLDSTLTVQAMGPRLSSSGCYGAAGTYYLSLANQTTLHVTNHAYGVGCTSITSRGPHTPYPSDVATAGVDSLIVSRSARVMVPDEVPVVRAHHVRVEGACYLEAATALEVEAFTSVVYGTLRAPDSVLVHDTAYREAADDWAPRRQCITTGEQRNWNMKLSSNYPGIDNTKEALTDDNPFTTSGTNRNGVEFVLANYTDEVTRRVALVCFPHATVLVPQGDTQYHDILVLVTGCY